MSSRDSSLAVPGLVYVGAAILIGIPATMVAYAAFGTAFEAVGLGAVPASPAGSLALLAVSLLIGLQLAVEATAVQLGGVEALGRGSPRVALARYLLVSIATFVLLAGVTWIGLSTALGQSDTPALVLGSLVGLAGVIVLYRGSSAFVAGLRAGGA